MSHDENTPVQTAGVNDIWRYNELHLDSAARDAGTNDEPTFHLPVPLQNVMGIKVLSAQIPFSYYVLEDDDTAITLWTSQVINNQRTLNPNPVTLHIPAGTYGDADYLASTLQNTLNSAVQGANYRYAVQFQPAAGQMKIYATKTADGSEITQTSDTGDTTFYGVMLQFPSSPSGGSLAQVLGMSPDAVYGNIPADNTTQPAYSVNTGFLNLTGPQYLQVYSNLAQRLSTTFLTNGSTTPYPPVIARIPVNVNPFQTITYTDANPAMFFDTTLDRVQTVNLSLRLGRREDNALSLNGVPWQIVIMVLTQRDTVLGRHTHDDKGRKRVRV